MGKKKKNDSKDSPGFQVIESNKKARHHYEILDNFEAGMELRGSEVKAIRAGGISLQESYVRVKNGECYLVGAHITPYQFAGEDAHDPIREKRLLLHKTEIIRLGEQIQQKGLTVVPLRVYITKRGRVKVELGLGKGKKLHDKRQDLRAKEAERDMARALKRG